MTNLLNLILLKFNYYNDKIIYSKNSQPFFYEENTAQIPTLAKDLEKNTIIPGFDTNNILFDNSIEFSTFEIFFIDSIYESIPFFIPELFIFFMSIFSFFIFILKFYKLSTNLDKLFSNIFYLDTLLFTLFVAFFLYTYNEELLDVVPVYFLFNGNFVLRANITKVKIFLLVLFFFSILMIRVSKLSKFVYFNRIRPAHISINPELIFILYFNIIFLLLLCCANHVMLFILLVQGLTITNYFLFLGPNNNIYSVAATVKYFIFSSWFLFVLLFSAFLFYFFFGTLFFDQIYYLVIKQFLNPDLNWFSYETGRFTLDFSRFNLFHYAALFSFFCLILPFFFKIGVAPLHIWSIALSETLSKPILFITMFVNKIGFIFIILKFSLTIGSVLFPIMKFVYFFFGLFSLIYSAYGLYVNYSIKKFFAYILVQSNGIIFLLLSNYNFFDLLSKNNIIGEIIKYLLISSLTWTVFFFVDIWHTEFKMFFCKKNSNTIEQLSEFQFFGAVLRKHPKSIYKFIFFVNFLIIAGFPPSIIFFVKFNLVYLTLQTWGLFFSFFILFLFVVPMYKIFLVIRALFSFDFDLNLLETSELVITDGNKHVIELNTKTMDLVSNMLESFGIFIKVPFVLLISCHIAYSSFYVIILDLADSFNYLF